MKFSIVIPALNEASWIGNTIQAVLDQDYDNFEVLIVDNNSSDGTAEVVSDYAKNDRRIKLLFCETRGVLAARSFGFEAADGDIIVQLDADNLAPSDWLSNAVRHFKKNRHLVALVGAYDYYDASWLFRFLALSSQYIFFSVGNYYVQKRKFGALMLGGNAFIKRSVLKETGGYNKIHTFYSDDLVTATQVAAKGKVKFYPDLTVMSSARRYKQNGYWKTQQKYNKGTLAVFLGRPIPCQIEEEQHPR